MRDDILDKTSIVARKELVVTLVTATSKTALAYYSRKIPYRFKVEGLDTYAETEAGTVTTSGVIVPGGNGIIVAGALAIDSTPEKYQVALSRYMVGGVLVEKAAATAIALSAGHVVSASKFGVILIQTTNAGVFSSKVPSATQAYATSADAVAALPAPDTGNIQVGYIIIEADSGGWTAITDDMTDGSGLTSATFVTTSALTPFANAVAFASLTSTVGTLSTTGSALKGYKNDYLVLHYTSDSSGALTNGQVTCTTRLYPLTGES